MPPFGPVKRKELIRYLHALGFEGPFSGGKHQFMIKGDITLRIPNPHQADIGYDFFEEFFSKPESAGMSGKRYRRPAIAEMAGSECCDLKSLKGAKIISWLHADSLLEAALLRDG